MQWFMPITLNRCDGPEKNYEHRRVSCRDSKSATTRTKGTDCGSPNIARIKTCPVLARPRITRPPGCTLSAVATLSRVKMDLRKPLYAAENLEPPCTVCVTGATGYIGTSVVARLLAAGHTVHATCRDTSPGKTQHLRELEGADERLRLFEADLGTPGGFDGPIKDSKYVIHLASIVRFSAPRGKGRALLIDPAVEGVENVLGSVNKFRNVVKVVMTSSVAAVVGDHWEMGKDYVYSEEDWNITCSDDVLPYHQSKMEAEVRAHEIAEEQDRWTLVVINPGYVQGPPLANVKCESVGFMRKLLNGGFYALMPSLGFSIVDVDDVAAAHTLAMVKKKANGRYLVTNHSCLLGDYVSLVSKHWSMYKLPWLQIPYCAACIASFFYRQSDVNLLAAIWGKAPKFDNSRSKSELGLTYIKIEHTIDDMVNALIRLQVVPDLTDGSKHE